MAQFIMLFIGSSVPDAQSAAYDEEWKTWAGGLLQEGSLIAAARFDKSGTVIDPVNGARPYDFMKDSSVTGYAMVEAADAPSAVRLTEGCPHTLEEYGSGMIEIRQLPVRS